MDLAKVIGTVVATRKDSSLEGTRLLVVQPLDEKQEPISDPLVAVDTLNDAGVGEIVYIVTGGDAVSVIPGKRMPVDVAVVGIVDSLSVTHAARPSETPPPETET
ncbi:MAG: EutN/CcmL family microcompartment protein [Candidatus Poribacteria bacterium]|nr:EutN/CcmL family microcompartment protein [Candidatus Poribacteria bacterium]